MPISAARTNWKPENFLNFIAPIGFQFLLDFFLMVVSGISQMY